MRAKMQKTLICLQQASSKSVMAASISGEWNQHGAAHGAPLTEIGDICCRVLRLRVWPERNVKGNHTSTESFQQIWIGCKQLSQNTHEVHLIEAEATCCRVLKLHVWPEQYAQDTHMSAASFQEICIGCKHLKQTAHGSPHALRWLPWRW